MQINEPKIKGRKVLLPKTKIATDVFWNLYVLWTKML